MGRPEIPKAHRDHCKCKPCGCWTPDAAGEAITCECGASYLRSALLSFHHWTCYDCKRVFVRRAAIQQRRTPPPVAPAAYATESEATP